MVSTSFATPMRRSERVDDDWRADGTLDLVRVNARLEGRAPRDILAWAVATFRGSICLQSSMQRRTSVLMHLLAKGNWRDVPVLFVDTGFHFAETLEAGDQLAATYGLQVITVRPERTPEQQREAYGRDLWRWPDTYELCCHLRKERPFVKAASRFAAIISGLQRAEGGLRSSVPTVGWDPRIEAYTVHPLASWSRAELDAFVSDQDIYLHPLYARGYPSIGCATCTTPCGPGEGERAGRWRHIREAREAEASDDAPVYCKINWIDRAPIGQ